MSYQMMGVIKLCDTDSITADLLSVSESNDEEIKLKLDTFSDHKGAKEIAQAKHDSDTCLEQTAVNMSTSDAFCLSRFSRKGN